jgi:sulfur transfer protein SufE
MTLQKLHFTTEHVSLMQETSAATSQVFIDRYQKDPTAGDPLAMGMVMGFVAIIVQRHPGDTPEEIGKYYGDVIASLIKSDRESETVQ